jgi:hypothetical protein
MAVLAFAALRTGAPCSLEHISERLPDPVISTLITVLLSWVRGGSRVTYQTVLTFCSGGGTSTLEGNGRGVYLWTAGLEGGPSEIAEDDY